MTAAVATATLVAVAPGPALSAGPSASAAAAPEPALRAVAAARLRGPVPVPAIASAAQSLPVRRLGVVESAVREVSETVAVPFEVVHRADAALEQGVEGVLSAGVPGQVLRTYLVRYVDGLETDRVLLGESLLAAPIAELRSVGTRPRQAPRAPAEIEAIVRDAADRWGADPSTLLRVAWCESRYNPSAVNARSGASGLFQFMPATFARNSVRAGFGGASIWDPVASANTAAMMFASSQSGQWACK